MLEGTVDGKTVRHLRLERLMRPKELAQSVGISEHWLRRIELHAQQPSEIVALRIARALEVHLSELLITEERAA